MPGYRTGMPRRLLVPLLLAATLATVPATAQADSYTVHACRLPDGSGAPADGWRGSTNGPGMFADTACPGRPMSGRADTSAPRARNSFTQLRFDAPADTRIAGWSIERQVATSSGNGWGWNYTSFVDEVNFQSDRIREQCWSTSGCTSLTGRWEGGGSFGSLILYLDCSNGPPNDCGAGSTASLRIPSARVVLEDAQSPAFAGQPSGSLLDTTAPQSGERGVSFTATDRGGGVYRAALEVDGREVAGGVVDANGGACAEPFSRVVPCKGTAGATLTLDTATLSDGPHSVRLVVFDATGTNRTAHGPVEITTDNVDESPGGPPPPAGCLTTPPLDVRAKLRRRTVGFRARGRVSGRVRKADGSPRGTVRLGLRRGTRELAQTFARPDGGFRFRVPAGPSRTLQVVAEVPGGGLACGGPLRLRVRAGATLRLSRRSVRLGRPVRFSGRVRGGRIPRRGKLVVLQARDVDGRWRIVRNLRTSRSGRYATTYRFRRSRGRFTYRFRVQVPRENGFPYALGYSRSRSLTVRGR